MDSRSLNRIVVLQRRTGAVDELNQPVPDDWEDLATVWANVRYLNGIETVKSDAPISVARASIRILRRTDVVAGIRAVLDGTIFDVRAVLPDEEYRERVDLACETGANQG